MLYKAYKVISIEVIAIEADIVDLFVPLHAAD
jgi:hypothetical protein